MGERIEPFPGVFPGTIQAPPDIARLVESSDLICLGTVADVSDMGEVLYLVGSAAESFRRLNALVTPHRSYKGLLPEGPVPVEVLQAATPSSLIRLEKGERAVLFLERSGHRYRLVDHVSAKIAIEPPDEHVRQALAEARGDPDQRVAQIATEIMAELQK